MWLVYALSAVVLTSTLGILFRLVALKSKDARTFSFLFNCTILLMTLLLVAFVGIGNITLTPWLTALMVVSGLGYGLFQRYQFTVRKHISASEIQILILPTGIAGYLLAIFWLHEAVTPLRVVGYAVILFAGLLVLKKKGIKFELNRYVILALFIGICLSLATTLDRQVASHFEYALTYTAVLWFAQSLTCFFPYVKLTTIRSELKLQTWRIPLLAVINLAVLFFQISAIKLAPVTKVAPIASMNVILLAIFSVIFLKERDRLWVKFIAAGLATLGLVLISR